ncbi:uncharacterized protein SPSC_00632 [Sporisorium scitamineum]|uniref:Transcription initiation factor TFIID subunit 8 n=1 Tax=Sporisorium scitamineum TaxID=49012 RepID=A0A0F7SC50_9BASI|nr:uncharacterized protein SPSC_00632 [Sporisorium scitamineum]CDW98775.1 hypothetical protein [Sporisorium scitamineum]
MPAGSVPSWAVTSSSAAIFGGGSGSQLNGRAAADAKLASSSEQVASSSTASQQQPQQQPPLKSIDYGNSSTAGAVAADEQEKPYKPKRKQKSITHCPPPTSIASSSRHTYSIPYVDESSANEALFQLIAVQAKRAGYDATTASALHEVSQLTKKFLTSVFSAATYAAELSCRDRPSARDLVYALETHGQPIRELRDFHRQQSDSGVEQDARAKARQHASAPKTYTARKNGSRTDAASEQGEQEDWKQGSEAFLPSDSDDGSELDAWSVSSDSDDEHANRRAAVHARVMKRKHDVARALAKKKRRQAKLRQPTQSEPGQPASSSSSARDLRALTSGEQAWRRVADHIVPRHFPGMPPRHAWMQTPAFPSNAYSSSLGGAGDQDDEASKVKKDPLILVNRKLANARLVEASLRRLIQNTDGAAAVAYAASSTRNGATTANADPPSSTAEKDPAATSAVSAAAPSAARAPAAASGEFVVPKTPASGGGGGGLTLRLNRKITLPTSALNSPSTPSTPIGSRRPSNAALVGGAGTASTSGAPGTPLGMGMSMGWGGGPLMSPLTPVSAAAGGPMTPYPPTPNGVYGHYFGSQPNASTAAGGNRSRSQSIVATQTDPYAGDNTATEQLGVRVPGPINYNNVWYAPGSTIASGGLAGAGASAAKSAANGVNSNHPRSVKRMRKWKV